MGWFCFFTPEANQPKADLAVQSAVQRVFQRVVDPIAQGAVQGAEAQRWLLNHSLIGEPQPGWGETAWWLKTALMDHPRV